MAQHGPDLAQHKPKMGPRWLNMGPTWPNMGTTCAQHRPRLLPYRQALRIMPASVLNIALPGFARRISAQSSHTISQTSLLGRRPAVRRKPLNMTRSGSQSLTAPEEKYMLCALCSHLLHSLTLNIKQLQLPLNFTRLPKENNTRVVAPNRKIGCNVTSLT